MQLITTLRPSADTPATEYRYQPARPLNRINLYEFKTLDDNFGDDPIGQSLERIDPILHHYDDQLNQLAKQDFFQKSLEQLFAEHPFEDSSPPFSMGTRRTR
jgi:membrane protein